MAGPGRASGHLVNSLQRQENTAHSVSVEWAVSLSQGRVVACMDNPEAIRRSVAEGMGVSVMSELSVQKEANAGKLLSPSCGSGF